MGTARSSLLQKRPPFGGLFVGGSDDCAQQQIRDRTDDAAAEDGGDGAEFLFAQQREAAEEQQKLYDAEIAERDVREIRLEQAEEEDRQAGRGDQRDDRRAQRAEHALDAGEIAVFVVEIRERQADDERRDDAAQRAQHRAEHAREARADECRRVDGDGAGRHLRDGDEVGELFKGHQMMDVDDLVLDQRDRRVAAADAEQAHLDKAEEQLQDQHSADFLSFVSLFRWMSRSAIPTARHERMMSIALTSKKNTAAKATTIMPM